MDGKEGSHFNNIMILVLLLVVIGVLGFTTLKNQVKTEPASTINQLKPSPTPLVILIETPRVSQTPDAGMTLEEAKQQKPPPPAALTIIRTPDGVGLEWKALRGSILSYNIYRIKEKGDFQKIASQPANETTEQKIGGAYEFIDTGVVVDTTYTYAITAINIFQKESDKSESVTITVPIFPF